MASTLLRQVRVVDPASQTDQVADVWMVDGMYRAIAPHLPAPDDAAELLDGTGKVLAPGLVDLYSHSGEPGYEARETLAALLQGAIAGGFTQVGILPDTTPPLDTVGALRHLLDLACELAIAPQPRLLPWAALTSGVQGQQMTELATLSKLQSLALAGFADGQPINHPGLLRRLLEYGHPLRCPIALWPCDLALVGNGIARAGSLALMGGLPGIPVAAETAALASTLELVREIGTPIHLMRISTARGVDLIDHAKAEGLPITASTTWMHLLFSTRDALTYNSALRLAPPLGNPEDQAALVAGVKSGILDAIAIDHQAHTYEDKTVAFGDAPPGAIGLALAFTGLWQQFVARGEWTALELLHAMSWRPARCLQREAGQIAVGHPVEAFLFNPESTWTIEPETLRSPATNTPFLNQSLRGKVEQVWL